MAERAWTLSKAEITGLIDIAALSRSFPMMISDDDIKHYI